MVAGSATGGGKGLFAGTTSFESDGSAGVDGKAPRTGFLDKRPKILILRPSLWYTALFCCTRTSVPSISLRCIGNEPIATKRTRTYCSANRRAGTPGTDCVHMLELGGKVIEVANEACVRSAELVLPVRSQRALDVVRKGIGA